MSEKKAKEGEKPRKPGAAGNVAPAPGQFCPAQPYCGSCTERDATIHNMKERAEKAENALAAMEKGHVERAMYDAVEKANNVHKAEIEMLIKQRDALKAELATTKTAYTVTRDMRDVLAAELDRAIEHPVKEYDGMTLRLHGALYYRWDQVVYEKKEAVAAAEQRAKDAEAKVKKLERDLTINTDFADDYHKVEREKGRRFCHACGTPYRVETEEKPEPHVPKWARVDKSKPKWTRAVNRNTHFGMKCLSCKNAQRTRAMLHEAYGCGKSFDCITCIDTEKGFEYEYKKYSPRYTRSQHRAASIKEQLKNVQGARKNEAEYYKTLIKSHEENEKTFVNMIIDTEQKGLEAVAKAAEVADKKVKALEVEISKRVPLENAIPAEITTEHVESENWKTNGDGGWRTRMRQVLRVKLPDGEVVDPKDVVLIKKSALPKKEEKVP